MGHLISKFGANKNDSHDSRPAPENEAVKEPPAIPVQRDLGLRPQNRLKRSSTTVTWSEALECGALQIRKLSGQEVHSLKGQIMGHMKSKLVANNNDSYDSRTAPQSEEVKQTPAIPVPGDLGLRPQNQLKRSSTTVTWSETLECGAPQIKRTIRY